MPKVPTRRGKDEFIQQLGVTDANRGKKQMTVDGEKLDDKDQAELIKRLHLQPDKIATDKKHQVDENTIFIYNISGSTFHVPHKFKLDEIENVIKFELGEIKTFHREMLNDGFMKRCIQDGKLKEVTAEDANLIEREYNKAKLGKTSTAGLAASGLPLNKKLAVNYIWECESVAELEAIAALEDREFILDAIDERLDELAEL